MPKNNVYRGTWSDERWYEVTVNGEPLNPRSDLCDRSPTGFAWGYGGSGPSQLALAILAHEYGGAFAMKHYMKFKEKAITTMPIENDWVLTSESIVWHMILSIVEPVELNMYRQLLEDSS